MPIPQPDEPRGFACAEDAFDEVFLDALQRRRSGRLVELFLRCFRRALGERSSGLEAVVARWTDEPFATAWSIPLGQLRGALLASPLDGHLARVAAASLGLELAAQGRDVRFEVGFERPEQLRFGRFALPAATTLLFESDGRTARAGAHTFTRAAGAWEGTSTPDLCIETTRRPVVLLPHLPHGTPLPAGLVASPASRDALEQIRPRYDAAYALLATYAPPYLTWVDRTVHSLLAVDTRVGTTTSSSFEGVPSVVALSCSSATIAMADALVHEASHQHYYALTQQGPVDDGSDTRLYFSPARGIDRPIDKILLAYHAFGNVLLFYRYCRAHGLVEDAELRGALERSYEEALAGLTRALETTRALTPLGRALYEPLARRLDQSEGTRVGDAHAVDTQPERRRQHV